MHQFIVLSSGYESSSTIYAAVVRELLPVTSCWKLLSIPNHRPDASFATYSPWPLAAFHGRSWPHFRAVRMELSPSNEPAATCNLRSAYASRLTTENPIGSNKIATSEIHDDNNCSCLEGGASEQQSKSDTNHPIMALDVTEDDECSSIIWMFYVSNITVIHPMNSGGATTVADLEWSGRTIGTREVRDRTSDNHESWGLSRRACNIVEGSPSIGPFTDHHLHHHRMIVRWRRVCSGNRTCRLGAQM